MCIIYKYLGVYIDNNLNWRGHVKDVLCKLRRSLSIMRHVSPFVSTLALRTLYNIIFLPYITYASTVWDTAPEQDLQKLQRMQNRAGKLLLGAPHRTPSTEVLTRLGWKDIKTIHRRQKALLTYKSLNNLLPDYMRQMFTYCRDRSVRTTRQSDSNLLYLPMVRREVYRRSIKYAGSLVWNTLPPQNQSSSIIDGFQKYVVIMLD